MRLLFVSHSFPPEDSPLDSIGGMQRVALDLSGVLAQRDDLLFHTRVLRSAWRWHHLQCGLWLVATAFHLHRIASQKKVDAILFSSMVTGALATLIRRTCKNVNIKLSAIAHGRDVTLPGIYQILQVRRTLKSLDSVVPVSRATALECVRRGMPQSRIQVIPNGVELSKYTMGEGSGDNGLQLLSVGRLVKRKGFAWFVDQVMPLLPSNTQYRIVGTGPERNEILETVASHRLEGRVHLLGRASEDELIKFYGEADLFIMPNLPVEGDMEGFGVVMLEAGASGTPSIAAGLEGIQDVITSGKNGTLVPSGNASKFKEAILNYPTTPQSREEARRHTVENFGWPSIAERFVVHLRTLHTGALID